MHIERRFSLATLLPADLVDGVGDRSLHVPTWAFEPDGWSFAFQRGLRRLPLDGRKVWEVGMGTGLNLLLLNRWFPTAWLRGSDYNPTCTALVRENLDPSDRIEILDGTWDLVTHTEASCVLEVVDYVIACIPQVPANGHDLAEGDNLSHYYAPANYPEARRHVLGLGLNEALLERAHHVLLPGGKVVLNLGGRPGLGRLLEMFRDYGYNPRIVHEEVIPQHADTSLSALARMEESGAAHFEFFVDAEGTQQVNAQVAEERRLAGQSLYHKIYVIEGVLMR